MFNYFKIQEKKISERQRLLTAIELKSPEDQRYLYFSQRYEKIKNTPYFIYGTINAVLLLSLALLYKPMI